MRIAPKKKNLSTIVILPDLHMEERRRGLLKAQSWKRRHMVILPQQNAVELRTFKMQDFLDS